MDFPRYRAITRGALPPQRLRTELRPELNARFVEAQSGTNGLAADLARLTALVAGCGRVLGLSDALNAANRPHPGAGLTVRLPAGWSAVVQGQIVVLDEALDLDDVPPGESYGYLALEQTEDDTPVVALLVTWVGQTRPDLEALGSPCIGKITADAARVTKVDESDETTIWSLPLLQRRLKALAGAPGGGGEGGGGGALFASQLPVNEDDATDTKSYIDIQDGKLDAKIELLGVGLNSFPAPFDVLADEIAITRAGLAEVNPHSIERGQISVVVINAGHGQDDTPDYTPDTFDPLELPWHPETGLFGP